MKSVGVSQDRFRRQVLAFAPVSRAKSKLITASRAMEK